MSKEDKFQLATAEQLTHLRSMEAVLGALELEVQELRRNVQYDVQPGLAASLNLLTSKLGEVKFAVATTIDQQVTADYWMQSSDKMARLAKELDNDGSERWA